jgi:hypothetical protein
LTEITETAKAGKPVRLATALKNYYGIEHPIYFKNASAGLYKDFSEIESVIPSVLEKVINTSGMIYQVNTMGGMINNESFAMRSAYPHRDINYLAELQTYWDSPNSEEKMLKSFESVQELFRNAGIKKHYRNYPDANFSDPLNSYYAQNLERLLQVKKQYDPMNVFGEMKA